MCGIAGILHFDRAADPALIRRMTDAMAHRGPDATNVFVEGGLALGHRRLSIIDLSTAANQPFVDHSGRYVMVFNGEIYNYEEVKKLVTGYPFTTTSDTEVLLAAYIKWGADCLQYLRGMFAFSIWDRQKEEMFIARDKLGVKPMYFFEGDGWLIFASEVRAILATGLVARKVNRDALLDYFSYQSVSYPHSLIEGIRQLEAGAWMRLRKGHSETARYWDVTNTRVDFDLADGDGVRRKIRELLLQSVRRRLVADVPVGAFLSGGIDSSIVVGLMAEASTDRPNTFNISFEEKEYDESHYAGIIAEKFNTRHTKLVLKPTDFLDELMNALNSMDTPSGDGINTYVVSKAIRRGGMTVALSGVGGDELFAGYPFFSQYLTLQKWKAAWQLPSGLRSLAARVLFPAGKGRSGRMMQLLTADSCRIEDVYPVFRQILSPALLKGLTRLAPSGAVPSAMREALLERKEQLAHLPLYSQVSAAEYLGYTQHTLLKDTDQMSMASSLEVREPFFDQDLVEFVMAIPDGLKKPVYPKSLLVEAVKPLLPEAVVHRKKQGFLFPWEHWLRNDLRSFCEGLLQRMAKRSFIEGEPLLLYWQKFLAGDKDTRWSELWLFIVLEYWLEKNEIEC